MNLNNNWVNQCKNVPANHGNRSIVPQKEKINSKNSNKNRSVKQDIKLNFWKKA